MRLKGAERFWRCANLEALWPDPCVWIALGLLGTFGQPCPIPLRVEMTDFRPTGLYSVPEVARLLGEKPRTIRRWAFGYNRRGKNYEPAIFPDHPEPTDVQALTFLDLVELLFIKGCLEAGVLWPKVREAASTAARLLGADQHPFAMKRWFVDPAGIYLMLGEQEHDQSLVEVAGDAQVAMKEALAPYLHQLDFDIHGLAQRWFPMGTTEPVLIDPRRSFGAPIIQEGGVRTDILAGMYHAGDSVPTVASWFEVEEHEVWAAIRYEEGRAA